MGRNAAFTLIELMIVVSIIGILAVVALPKFASVLRKSREGASKGNLAGLRSAIMIYYADMEGQYPFDARSLTIGGKYMGTIPSAMAPDYHSASSGMSQVVVANVDWQVTGAGWMYDNTGVQYSGGVRVNCTHTDTAGNVWTSY